MFEPAETDVSLSFVARVRARSLAHEEKKKGGNSGAQSCHMCCVSSRRSNVFFLPPSIQRGKEEYKLAATSDGKEKKSKKGKGKGDKDMDDLKKEVDLVSKQIEKKKEASL